MASGIMQTSAKFLAIDISPEEAYDFAMSEELGSRLLAALKARAEHESINAIAKASGVGQSTLHRFLHGERSLSLEMAGKLAAYLGLTLTPQKSPPAEKPSAPTKRPIRKKKSS